MRYRIRHTTKYAYSEPVALCHNLVRLTPNTTERVTVASHRLIVAPEPSDITERVDVFGNRVRYFSIEEPHRRLSLTAISELSVNDPPPLPAESAAWEAVRDAVQDPNNPRRREANRFVFASPLVTIDTRLADYAATSFQAGTSILDGATDLTARLHADFAYDPRATTVSTPVLEAFDKRAGVCQDFAHLQIACLRSIGLAARYVSGYLRTIPPEGKPRLVGADASHAWLSVYCERAGWIEFDPTNNCVTGTDHVPITVGRDYGDVCPIQGVFVGGGTHTMNVEVDVEPLADVAIPHRRRNA